MRAMFLRFSNASVRETFLPDCQQSPKEQQSSFFSPENTPDQIEYSYPVAHRADDRVAIRSEENVARLVNGPCAIVSDA
jgi:hypothetical protein